MNPLVSIIIPCFNAEKYLREAVDSALSQTYQPVEVIVIDDGSNDGSRLVLESYGDRIRWESQPNRGAPAARNRGLALAKGELIQFLDADDVLLPNKLHEQVPVACRHSECITYTDYYLQTVNGGKTRYIHLPPADEPVYFALNVIPLISGPLHRIGAVQKIGGFREELACCQDYDLLLRLACAGARFYPITRALWTCRRVPGSLSGNMLKILDQWNPVYEYAIHELSRNAPLSDVHKAAFAGKMAKDARHYLKLGRKQQGLTLLNKARALHSDAAVQQAYPSVKSRWCFRLLGPVLTEKITLISRHAGDCRRKAVHP